MSVKPVYEYCNPAAAQDLQTAVVYLMKIMEVMVNDPSSVSGNVITEVLTLGNESIAKSLAK